MSVALAWSKPRQLGAKRPGLGRTAWGCPPSALRSTDVSINACIFLLKSVWDLVLSLVAVGGPNLSLLKPFSLGLCILYKTTLDLLIFALMSTLTKDDPELQGG